MCLVEKLANVSSPKGRIVPENDLIFGMEIGISGLNVSCVSPHGCNQSKSRHKV
jgi:hypothetical protein